MMEAEIIQTDVLKWTGHHRGGNCLKKKMHLFLGVSL